jgi:serine/threonine-protein kinase
VGTSGRVYRAYDSKLQRVVAVKVLHEALADDAAFLAQFRREARSASVLSHSHIVTVYDWAEDSEDSGDVAAGRPAVPYLVTEYLGGGTLRAMLDRGTLLTPSQALLVGLQAAQGLAEAHRHGLVHRDVKPGNLLFHDDGRLCLADFGLARALAEASWTEPVGAGIGTARYASPEQVMGRLLDGRSDVYSLALVLAEAVTGRVPLLGDSPAATMALRAQHGIDVPTSLGALRAPLLRAGALELDERCDAGELEIALMAAAEHLPPPEPLPLVPTDPAGERTTEWSRRDLDAGLILLGPGEAPTVASAATSGHIDLPGSGEAPAPGDASGGDAGPGDAAVGSAGERLVRDPITVAAEHEALVMSRPGGHGVVDPVTGRLGPGLAAADAATVAPATGSRRAARRAARASRKAAKASQKAAAASAAAAPPVLSSSAGPSTEGRAPRRGRRRVLVTLAVVLLAAGAATGWWFLLRTPTHEVPDWQGAELTAARAEADDLGWTVQEAERVRVDGTVAGEVVGQSPEPGTTLAEGEAVRLTVSLGPPLVAFPAVAGLAEDEAGAALTGAGLVVGARTTAFDEEVAAGAVVSAAPAAGSEPVDAEGRLPKGTSIDLVVSDGPAPRTVPAGLVGASLSDARAALAAVQLRAAATEEYSDSVAEGVVVRAGAEAGTQLPRDSVVDLVVSLGPRPVPIPDVLGQTGSAAAATLESQGFTVSGIEGSPNGTVLATDPPAGEPHQLGTAVRIFTRR